MSLATALQDQPVHNPWPPSAPNVIFLLDATRRFERRVLEQWTAAHDSHTSSHTAVLLDLLDDRKPLNVEKLSEALQQYPYAILAPLRVTCLQPEKSASTGPRLRDALRGGERRPPDGRADRVVRLTPERVHLNLGEPGANRDLAERFQAKTGLLGAEEPENFAVFVARQAAVVIDIAERQSIGGRYIVPRYVHHSISNNRAFRAGPLDIANGREQPTKAVRAEASEHLREMISIATRFWVDVSAKLCGICQGLGYEKTLHYDPNDLERIRHIVRHYPSALLWTHKTYIDGFVVPKILFDNDFPMPHFFGGANLNIPILGFFLRKAGGIFIRRRWQDNGVYKLSLKQYIGYFMEERFPIARSLKGTRARLGKLMPPKYGLLKNVLEGAHHAGSRDIHIIPVSVSYDCVEDAQRYAREQSGTPKTPESVGWMVRYLKTLARPMGGIHVDFGEPVQRDAAPDPEDQLAISKGAFQVAVEANRVTPTTFPAVISTALLDAFPRALAEPEIVNEVSIMTEWTTARGVKLSPDFNLHYAKEIGSLLANMIEEGIITRFEGGLDTVHGVAEGQAPIASFYRNTIVHFLLTRADAELALLTVSKQRDSGESLPYFWSELQDLRDLFKFEFFYPDTQLLEQQIDVELCRDGPNWQTLLSESNDTARLIMNRLSPELGHVAFTIFAEAYSIGTDILIRHSGGEPMEEDAFIYRCMSYGKQAYLQRRISSEASIGKLLFANAWKMLMSRGLIDDADDRSRQAEALNQLTRRHEVICALGIADRGASTLRDVARETL